MGILHHSKYMQPMKCLLVSKRTPTHATHGLQCCFLLKKHFSNAKVGVDNKKEPTSFVVTRSPTFEEEVMYIYIRVPLKKEPAFVLRSACALRNSV